MTVTLTEKCSAKHSNELKFSHFDITVFEEKPRHPNSQRNTERLNGTLLCINTDQALAVARTKYD